MTSEKVNLSHRNNIPNQTSKSYTETMRDSSEEFATSEDSKNQQAAS